MRRSVQPIISILTLTTLIITLLLSTQLVSATITLANKGTQYHSRPASFGFNLEYGLQYVALLQVVEDDLHLCGGINDVDDNDNGPGEEEDQDEFGGIHDWVDNDHGIQQQRRGLGSSLSLPSFVSLGGGVVDIGIGGEGDSSDGDDNDLEKKFHDALSKNSTKAGNEQKKKKIHVVPSHGVPVAILAKRGQCSYETKAKVAQELTTPKGAVRFVIVYDNVERDGNHLITMMPKDDIDQDGRHKQGHELWKGVGLLFVSYESGVDLHEWINTQAHYIKAQGGPRILIDGADNWSLPPMDQSAAGMAFLLMLFGCVCSMSLFLNTTFGNGRNSNDSIISDHHLFFLGPDGQMMERPGNRNSNNSRRRGNLRLLTMEEVETLSTREYQQCSLLPDGSSSDEDEDGTRSPPSSSLELSKAADTTSCNDEEQANTADDCSRCGSGGGLCEALLPTKKEDPYFDQNTCSICLDEYESGEQIRVLPCQHTFHSECIFPWLTERSPTCPLCKAMFEAVQYEEEEEDEEDQQDEVSEQGHDDEQHSVRTEASAVSSPPPPHRPTPREDNNEEPASERQSSTSSAGIRGRLWGLFNATVATDTVTPEISSTLDEPLLGGDTADGNDNVV